MKKSFKISMYLLFFTTVMAFISCTNEENILKAKVKDGVSRFAYGLSMDTTKIKIDSIKIFNSLDDYKIQNFSKEKKKELKQFLSDSIYFTSNLLVEVEPYLYEVYLVWGNSKRDAETIFPEKHIIERTGKPLLYRMQREKEYCGRNHRVSNHLFNMLYAAERAVKFQMKYPESFKPKSSKLLKNKPLGFDPYNSLPESECIFFEIEGSAKNGFGLQKSGTYIAVTLKECSENVLFSPNVWIVKEYE